jgi:hypothetical protein
VILLPDWNRCLTNPEFSFKFGRIKNNKSDVQFVANDKKKIDSLKFLLFHCISVNLLF